MRWVEGVVSGQQCPVLFCCPGSSFYACIAFASLIFSSTVPCNNSMAMLWCLETWPRQNSFIFSILCQNGSWAPAMMDGHITHIRLSCALCKIYSSFAEDGSFEMIVSSAPCCLHTKSSFQRRSSVWPATCSWVAWYRRRGRVVKGVGHLDHVWSYGVRKVVSSIPDRGNIVGWVFHPTRWLVRFPHLNMPFLPNSEFI